MNQVLKESFEFDVQIMRFGKLTRQNLGFEVIEENVSYIAGTVTVANDVTYQILLFSPARYTF